MIFYDLAVRLLPPLTFTLTLAVSGCSTTDLDKRTPNWGGTQNILSTNLPDQTTLPHTLDDSRPIEPDDRDSSQADFISIGNDTLVKKSSGFAESRRSTAGDIKLNFVDANIVEVVKVILGDILESSYVVDPSVQGKVTMQTIHPLPEEDVIPTLELLLRMNNAAMIYDDGTYRIVPIMKALSRAKAPQLGDSISALPRGYTVRVVPIRYISAGEMAQILEPFTKGSNQLLRLDSKRNLLILAAPSNDMERLLETIDMFDVNQMKGMSIALFTPEFVQVKTLSEELEKILADSDTGLLPGLVRFVTLERLNGLVVVTHRAEHLVEVKNWINRLDRDLGTSNSRLYVYRVQNGKAPDLAQILNDLFDGTSRPPPLPRAQVAPGLKPVHLKSETESTSIAVRGASSSRNGYQLNQNSTVKIIADEPNNALLILSDSNQYRQILGVLKQLDVSPMQVLVEVTIAEVTLSDDLQYGVEWFFNNKVDSGLTGVGTLDLGQSGIAGIVPGFSYALQSSGNTVNAVLNLLASESNLSIISSPSLLVLNNQEASIQVGDEVPVATQQQQSTDSTSNILNSIEYRNTGVQLTVKPRINAGGLVIMDVEQETSIVPTTNNTDPLTPRIQTRKIASTVAVNSGDTIILGGLIENNRNRSEAGIPGLHKVPLFGDFFGTKADNQDRTELLVLITPKAVSHRAQALQVTEEFRRKLHSIIPTESENFDKTNNEAAIQKLSRPEAPLH